MHQGDQINKYHQAALFYNDYRCSDRDTFLHPDHHGHFGDACRDVLYACQGRLGSETLIPYPDNTGPGNKVMEPPFVPVHSDHDKTKSKEQERHDISEVSYKSPPIPHWLPCDPDYPKAKQPLS